MSSIFRTSRHALVVLAGLAAAGCTETASETASQTATEAPAGKPETAAAAPAPAAPAEPEVKLEAVKWDEFLKRMANKDAKYTLVDAWASWCAPCKENFPHLVEMHKKYAGKGLAVVSLSFDDPALPKQVDDA